MVLFGIKYSFIAPLIARCRHELLKFEHLIPLRDYMTCESVVDSYRAMTDEKQSAGSSEPVVEMAASNDAIAEATRALPIWSALWAVVRDEMMFAAFCGLIRITALFTQVFALSAILDIIGGEDEGRYGDSIYVQLLMGVLLGFAAYVVSVCHHNMMHNGVISGIRSRAMLCGRIYEKTLSQTPLFLPGGKGGEDDSSGIGSQGQQLNLASSDANAIIEAMIIMMFLISSPFEICIASVWLGLEIKWAAIATAACTFLFLPLQLGLGSKVAKLRGQSFAFADRRLAALTDYLNGIGVVKFNAWEDAVVKQVTEYRRSEGELLESQTTLKLLSLTLFFVVPAVLSMVTFGVLNTYNDTMSPRTTFIAIALVQLMSRSFAFIPRATVTMANARASVARIESFLLADFTTNLPPGVLPSATAGQLDGDAALDEQFSASTPGAVIRMRGSFAWDASGCTKSPRSPTEDGVVSSGFRLSGVDIGVVPGKLLAVTGPVGSGKSTLLHAMLRNCALVSATSSPSNAQCAPGSEGVQIDGSVAYVAQEAWITDGTIRDNILFGKPFDEDKYKAVVAACCLHRDIVQWGGDFVEVGEKGVTLSGGQRQRVAMARACYADSDTYLLDDPLSAVDSKVGRHIIDQVLMSPNMLRNKAVVLATHNHAAIGVSDAVAMMTTSGVIDITTPAAALAALEELKSSVAASPAEDQTATTNTDQSRSDPSGTSAVYRSGDEAFDKQARELFGQGATPVEEESMVEGGVSRAVYAEYARAGGKGKAALFVCSLILAQVLRSVADWWFTVWAERSLDLSNTTYLLILLGLVAGAGIIGALRAVIFSAFATQSSTVLHDNMFSAVLRSPMHFFATTPLGRITNRFSKDVDFADDLLPRISFDFLQLLSGVLGALVLVVVGIPWFAIAVVVFGFIFICLVLWFMPAARQIKRIEGLSRSPSNQQFQATLSGLTTIRAFDRTADYRATFFKSIDLTTQAIINYDYIQRWIGARMDWISSGCALVVGVLCIALQDSISRSVAGLAISQIVSLANVLQYGTRLAAETESIMTSVERIDEYGRLPPENDPAAGKDTQNEETKPAWPSSGSVAVTGLKCAYETKPDNLVLKGIDFSAEHGSKIAVVGRTGAGKSTLLQCFYRLVAVEHNMIRVDGVDVASLPLKTLREGLAVIPQAPTLFNGSLRYNLDPFDEFSDDVLIRSLHHVQLLKNLIRDFLEVDDGARYAKVVDACDSKDEVLGLDVGDLIPNEASRKALLSSSIGEQGGALSVGQKQLLCAARALLKQPKLLFMDEATANVDDETDQALQFMIRIACRNTTVITIAHRLQTVLDYDMILVLDGGNVAEYGAPDDLRGDDDSVFSSMLAASLASGGLPE